MCSHSHSTVAVSKQCTVATQCAVHSHCTVHSAQSLYSTQCTVTVQYTVHSHCTVHSAQCTVHSHCTVCSHSVQCTVNVQDTVTSHFGVVIDGAVSYPGHEVLDLRANIRQGMIIKATIDAKVPTRTCDGHGHEHGTWVQRCQSRCRNDGAVTEQSGNLSVQQSVSSQQPAVSSQQLSSQQSANSQTVHHHRERVTIVPEVPTTVCNV